MPQKETQKKSRSVGANVLNKLVESGVESVVLTQRQRYATAAQALNHYIGPLGACECGHWEDEHALVTFEDEGAKSYRAYCRAKKCACLWWNQRERAYPHFLPTQANGRWSTTSPPVTNFPKACLRSDCPHRVEGRTHAPISAECWDAHRVFKPDPGWWWLVWDKDAIEARIDAVLTEDEDLIHAFMAGLDVHTITACRTFGLPMPPDLVDPHNSPDCELWRRQVDWGGKEDLRRRLAKVQRFGCFYGPDERAILGAKGVEELGLSREELLEATRKYLASQPKLQSTKERRWDGYLRNPEARTVWGRRLRCYPTYQEKRGWLKALPLYRAGRSPMRPGEAQKVLWNFEHSGAVADHVNGTIIAVKTRWPKCRLVFNKHDSLTFAFLEGTEPYPAIKEIDEVTPTWPNGLSIPLTSTWHKVYSDGTVEHLK